MTYLQALEDVETTVQKEADRRIRQSRPEHRAEAQYLSSVIRSVIFEAIQQVRRKQALSLRS